MAETRRGGVLAVVAVVVLGVAAVVLVVLASAGGSVRPVSESTLSASPRTVPVRSITPPSMIPAPTAPAQEQDPVESLRWLTTVFQALLYVAVALVVLLLLRALYRMLRRVRLPEAEADDTDWDRVVVARLVEAVDSGLATVDSGTATDAVIACWVTLEDAAASIGVARASSETPAEFTVRVLGVGGVSEPELLRLAQLYREARYSGHESSEAARSQARAALLRLRTDLEAVGTSAARDRSAAGSGPEAAG